MIPFQGVCVAPLAVQKHRSAVAHHPRQDAPLGQGGAGDEGDVPPTGGLGEQGDVEEGLVVGDDEGVFAEGQWVASNYCYNRAATIYGGSNEIQRNIIAKNLVHRPSG